MISSILLKRKILESAFCGKLTKISEDNFTNKHINEVMDNYDSKRKPVSKNLRGNLDNNYDYYGATGKIDMINEYIFDGNYLLIGEDGGNFFVDRDNSFIVDGKFWANNHVHVLSSGNSITNKYIMHYLNSLDFPKMGLISGVAVPKLNQKNLNSIIVPICSIEEQKRIVNKVDELFELIDKKEENDQEKERLVKVLKDKILSEEFSKEWPINNVLKVCNIIMGQSPNGDSVNDKNDGIEFHQGKKYFGEKYLNDSGIYTNKPTKVVDEDTIIMSVRAPVGDINVTKNKICLGRGLCAFIPKEQIDNGFLYWILKMKYEEINNMAKGTTFISVTSNDLKKIDIPVPTIEEQKRIVEKIESLFELIEQL